MERIGLIYNELNNSIATSLLLESQLKARLVKNLAFTSIFLAINKEQKRVFLLSTNKILDKKVVDSFPTWNGIVVYQKKMFNPFINKEGWFLVFEQKELIATDIFEYLVGDIVNFVISATSFNQLISRLKKVLFKWQTFFHNKQDKALSEQQQQGLLGELLFIMEAISFIDRPEIIISNWYGPEREKIDFQFNDIGIEIKTSSAGKPYKITITKEDQLETDNLTLYLNGIMFEKTLRKGITIKDAIDKIRELLKHDADVLRLFNEKLFNFGIIEPNLNESSFIKFIVKDSFYYLVNDGFPRITRNIIPNGIFNINYQLSLDSCNSFQIQEENVFNKVKDVIK